MADRFFDFETVPALIATGGPLSAPGQANPQEVGATGENGAPIPRSSGGGLDSMFPLIILMIVAMLVITMFGQRREKKKREALMSSIRKHDRVQTNGGIIGAIVEIKPDTVVLKVDESSNTRITFSRAAIQQVLSPARSKDSPADLEPEPIDEGSDPA